MERSIAYALRDPQLGGIEMHLREALTAICHD